MILRKENNEDFGIGSVNASTVNFDDYNFDRSIRKIETPYKRKKKRKRILKRESSNVHI